MDPTKLHYTTLDGATVRKICVANIPVKVTAADQNKVNNDELDLEEDEECAVINGEVTCPISKLNDDCLHLIFNHLTINERIVIGHGTTLMQELVWMVDNNLDYEASSKTQLFDRCPFLEFNTMWDDKFLAEVAELNGKDPKVLELLKNADTPVYETAKSMKRRHIKTHLPPSLLPPTLIETCKVIYVARNPFDVVVSYYHHCKYVKAYDFQGDFHHFWGLFERNLVVNAPYWEHVKEGWANRHHPNFLFMFYEDLIRDMPGNIRKVAKFLNKQMTQDEVMRLADHLHIDNFRKNVKVANIMVVNGMTNSKAEHFIRRGKVGGNKEFDDEIKLKAENWFKENLAKTDIKFPEFKV